MLHGAAQEAVQAWHVHNRTTHPVGQPCSPQAAGVQNQGLQSGVLAPGVCETLSSTTTPTWPQCMQPQGTEEAASQHGGHRIQLGSFLPDKLHGAGDPTEDINTLVIGRQEYVIRSMDGRSGAELWNVTFAKTAVLPVPPEAGLQQLRSKTLQLTQAPLQGSGEVLEAVL